MKSLIAEDEFVSRELLKKMLSPYGKCDIAVNGDEAVKSFKKAVDEKEPYDLLCLDIMMPIKDGPETLKEIRKLEQEAGIKGSAEVKVIVTTALDDQETVISSMTGGAAAYVVKPIRREKILGHLHEFGLI